MPIEKMTLGLQVVSTIATIWLGYVGYELAKAQNQIAEVQTYGLPPTVNMRADFDYSTMFKKRWLAEGTLKVQINNNHTYPITVHTMRLDTQLDARLDVLDRCHGNILDKTKPITIFTCSIDEIMEAGEVKFIDLPFSFPHSGDHPVRLLDERPVGLDYYDPVLNRNMNTGGPALRDNEFTIYARSFDSFPTITVTEPEPEPEAEPKQSEPDPEQLEPEPNPDPQNSGHLTSR